MFFMKKGLVFFLGMLTGCVLTIAALFYIAKVYNSEGEVPGLVLYEQPAGAIDSYSFKVMQVLPNGNALANSESAVYKDLSHTGPTVLLLADENSHYYDDQIVKVPKGKKAYQVGVFDYETRGMGHKTVPVVKFLSK